MREIAARQVEVYAASLMEDAAFAALADVAQLTERFPETRVVGGQMVMLLLHLFPVEGAVGRSSQDADAGITLQLAASGAVHEFLCERGYQAVHSNHYVRGPQEIDVLIPAGTQRFEQEELDGRVFDASPGLGLIVGGPYIEVALEVHLFRGGTLSYRVRVPTVELALIVKALAFDSRRAAKDLADIHDLLLIQHVHGASEIGDWKIVQHPRSGARKDAAVALSRVRQLRPNDHVVRESLVPLGQLRALIRSAVPEISDHGGADAQGD